MVQTGPVLGFGPSGFFVDSDRHRSFFWTGAGPFFEPASLTYLLGADSALRCAGGRQQVSACIACPVRTIHTDTHKHLHTHTHTQTQTDRQAAIVYTHHTHRQTDKQTGCYHLHPPHTHTHTDRQAAIIYTHHTHRQTDRQTGCYHLHPPHTHT